MTHQKAAPWKMVLAFAIVYLVWGSTYLGIRYAIETIPPLLMAGTRFLFAGIILFAVGWWRTKERPKLIHWRTAAVIGVLLLFCGNGGVTIAEQKVASGMAALLITSEPLWIVLLNWLRPGGTRPTTHEVVGVVLGFGGVALLLAPQLRNGFSANSNLGGSLMILGASFAWALGSLYGIKAPAVKDRPMANGMIMVVGGGVMLLAGLLSGEAAHFDVHQISTTSFAAWAYLSLFGSLAAFSAFVYLMQNTTPTKASTYAFVNPVVAVVLGWGIAGEPMDGRSLLAIVIIVGAVMMITVFHPKPVSPAEPADVFPEVLAESTRLPVEPA